jgi:hypothetical protein
VPKGEEEDGRMRKITSYLVAAMLMSAVVAVAAGSVIGNWNTVDG